ncbi:MAG: AI-2E family transporter [Phycisphaeraceae bacterium]|nr:AI-2E family transporter [Phycisphaerae bacterium]MBX3392400.1 AI-2E family transporter [Phycisphaeraceae bacterium]HRJ49004.1 AI-2E family transporter [Phycisphaerales bacterium]
MTDSSHKPPQVKASPAPTSGGRDWRQMHLWQMQPVRDGLVIAAVVGLLYLGKLVSIVTVPMLLALLLAYLFEPLIRRVTASGHMSRPGAALSIIVLVSLLIIVPVSIGAVMGVLQAASVAGNIAQNTGDLIKSVDFRVPTAERKAAYTRLDEGFWRWSSDGLTGLRREISVYRRHRALMGLDPGGGARGGAAEVPEMEVPRTQAPEEGEPPSIDKDAPPAAGDEGVVEEEFVDQDLSDMNGEAAGAARHGPDGPPDLPAWKEQVYNAADSLIVWLRDNSQEIARSLGRQALGGTAQVLQSALGVLGSLGFLLFGGFVTAFFFFFFSTGWGRVLDFWEGLIPERRKHRVIELVMKMDGVIAGFIRGRLIICFILSVYMTLAYFLIGVPSAFLVGPLIGVLFIAPYVHVVGVPLAMALMFLEPSGLAWQNSWWWIVLAPIVVYMGAQVLDDYILSPAIQGKNTNMDTPTIVFASLAGGALAGVYGLLLAIPVAACLKILAQEVLLPRIHEWARGRKPDFLPIEE